MPLAASVLIGPAEIALTRMFSRPEVDREIFDAGLQRRLGDAHHVVVRDDLLGAVIGQRQQRSAVGHHRRARAARPRRSCRPRCSSSSGNCRGWCRRTCPRSSFLSEKPIAWTTKSIVAQRSASVVEGRVERRHVGRRRNRSGSREPSSLGERAHALLQRLALIGEREFGALRRASAWAMPQASERSLARPMISPRLPSINPVKVAVPLSAVPAQRLRRAAAPRLQARRCTARYRSRPLARWRRFPPAPR